MRTFLVVVLLVSACSDKKPTNATDKPSAATKDQAGSAGASGSGRDGTAPGAANALCVRGVTHVTELMAAETKAHGAGPSPDEQRVIDGVTQASITQCQSEGFTQAQLDCLLAAKDFETFKQVGSCPAIQAKRPGWLTGI